MRPSRGNLLVRPIETDETVGGVVLLEETRQRWVGQQCEVIAIGEPEICEDEDCERPHWTPGIGLEVAHPCPVVAGDWILVRPRSYTATDIDNQWIVRQDDVLARLTLADSPTID